MRRLACALVLCLAAAAANGEEAYPFEGLTPPQKVGGMVSIVGMPLPPVPRSSVRSAIAVYEPILAGLRLVGDTHALARGYGTLATMYAALGDMAKAESLFDDAQAILEKNGAESLDLAWVYNNRGMVQMENGEHAQALALFRKALAVLDPRREELLNPRAIALQNLGSAYCLIGDAQHSEAAYLESLEIMRALKKEGSTTHQNIRGNLALLYATMGDYAEARGILNKLVTERGLSKPLRFQILNTLGHSLTNLRAFPEAETRLLEAKSLTGEGDHWRAIVLLNLTALYSLSRDYDRAEAVGQEAVKLNRELYGDDSRMAAAAMGSLGSVAFGRGELLKADRLFTQTKNVLSKRSGDLETYIFVLRGLALVAQRRGQDERARTLSREALDLAKRHLEQMLAFGSETQRLAYQSQSTPFDQLANLGDADLLAEATLAMKGAVLESLLAERALARKTQAPADQEQQDRINALKVEIMETIGRGGDIEELRRELRKEQAALTRRLASRPYPTHPRSDLSAVRGALQRDRALIEIIRYQRYADGGELVPSYGGIVIPASGALRWVALGDAEVLDGEIENLLSHFAGGGRSAEALRPSDADVVAALRELHERLWAPLAKAIPEGTKRVLLSPDATTSFLPWAALLDADGAFLAERWCLSQVSSSRDLLRAARGARENTLVAFADGGGDLQYSRREVSDIARTAERLGWKTTVLVGEAAAENDLQRYPRPGILHLATHGGQLREDATQAVRNRLSKNPMYRGYLLLGGGKETLETWKSGASAPFSNDGILTAEEASGLDLSETWLTVLSACETGAGDVRAGEGVLGLRRGFTLAGTKNLMFSLWSVRDDATAEFMTAFYQRLFESNDPETAFQETQRAELRRWSRQSIPAAVYRAAAFVLTQ